MIRVLLVSTYDLGRQPFGLASPAAWLRAAGAAVRCLDLAVETLDPEAVRSSDAIAFHIPMHTATRLAVRALARFRVIKPQARFAFFGLYAAMNESYLRSLGAEAVFGGEFEPALVRWVTDAGDASPHRTAAAAVVGETTPATSAGRATVSLERLRFLVPDRAGLPPLLRYAHLHDVGGSPRTVGATEASRGCKHLCRHCPIVPVYGGRFRIVQRDVVLEDIRRQVAAGARHITFGDPDFFNGIGHAIPLVRALHSEHPEVSYDVTIKISHLLEHSAHLATLKQTGCAFVTSAVESVDDLVLDRLDKRHTAADFVEVARRFRSVGLTLQPTFVAFHPWLTVAGFLDLLETIERLDLIEHVAPVQLAIRLLIPAGSRLLELDEVRALAGPFDPVALLHPWHHPDPRVDRLQAAVEAAVRDGMTRGLARAECFDHVFALAESAAQREAMHPAYALAGARAGGGGGPVRRARNTLARAARAPVPYLSEPWYC